MEISILRQKRFMSERTSAKDELKMFQEVAKELPGFDDRQLATALSSGEIVEVCDGNDKA
jgi:hypothetical protein